MQTFFLTLLTAGSQPSLSATPQALRMRRDGGWLTRRSFRSRITLLVVAAVGSSVALCALISYLAISKTIMNRMDAQLEQRASVFTAVPLEMFSPAGLDAGRQLLASSG